MKFKYQSSKELEPYLELSEVIDLNNDKKTHIVFQVLNGVVGDSRVIKVAESAQELGYEVTILGMSRTKDNIYTSINNINVILVQNPKFNLLKMDKFERDLNKRDYRSFVNQYFESSKNLLIELKPDILHTHDMYGIEIGYLMCNYLSIKGFNIPWIHDIHEYVLGLDHLPKNIMNYCSDFEAKRIHDPDYLFTVSNALADKLEEHYELKERPLIINNSPRLDSFKNNYQPTLRKSIGLDDEQLLGIYVGRIGVNRGILNIIEVLELNTDLNIAIITNQEDSFREECIQLAKNLNVDNRLYFHEYVDNSEVSSFIQDADFGLNPLLSYGNSEVAIPTKVSEYVHANLPIVTSSTAAMVEFMEKYQVGTTFEPGNTSELSKAINDLVANYKTFRSNITEDLKYRYSWDFAEHQLKEVYETSLTAYKNRELFELKPKYKIEDLRVLHGLSGAANQPYTITRGLRNIGFKVADNTCFSSGNKMHYGRDFELSEGSQIRKNFYYLNRLLPKYDLFHFHFRSLYRMPNMEFPTGLDLLELKSAGKLVVMSFRGGEIRLHSKFKEINKFNYVDENPNRIIESNPEEYQKKFIEYCRAVCDQIIVSDPEMLTYVPDAKIVPRSINLELFQHKADNFSSIEAWEEEGPLIVHVPSREGVKGSHYIQKALEELRQEGHNFRFEFITDVAHDEVIEMYSKADIVIDQLRIGWYGVASVEAMALGKCTVAYIRDDIEHHLTPFKKPIVNANPENIKDVMKELIYDRSKVIEKGRIGRKFVEDYHCMDKVAVKYKNIYKEAYQNRKSVDPILLNKHILNMLEGELKKTGLLKKEKSRSKVLDTRIAELRKQNAAFQKSSKQIDKEKNTLRNSNIALAKKIRLYKGDSEISIKDVDLQSSEGMSHSLIDKVHYFLNDGTSKKQIFDAPIRNAPFRIMKKLGIKK
ncbi:glycosyltransferase [Psychrobacter fozii]|uniref:Glycosyltransferase involved in cell wall biosynthesis n=1 Tax=Psychrobacter fozii TaxID=198480 RepID=A0A2V4V525_9GAMM|nr:glycosyltransferase [Psychrobacter fozii]PYE41061.1 glycosyltransferase involved in cell wall biosynthesis [Psychrobacter fozii]